MNPVKCLLIVLLEDKEPDTKNNCTILRLQQQTYQYAFQIIEDILEKFDITSATSDFDKSQSYMTVYLKKDPLNFDKAVEIAKLLEASFTINEFDYKAKFDLREEQNPFVKILLTHKKVTS